MGAYPHYGWVRGDCSFEEIGVDADYGAAPARGDMVYLDDTTGMVLPCAENAAAVYGVLDSGCPAPTGLTDGTYKVKVITSRSAVFAYPVQTGTIAQGQVGETCDVYSKQSVDLTHNEDALEVVGVDTVNSVVFVKLRPEAAARGIVAA